ncbi:putative photosynthetic complex assembly protein PuhE [Afifella sp. H1R]|uniref:putative photosynthetic complex assembly protein PuhE n=1 Tax=unclassified Afifella TaxID=2624128 RepID=UPI001EEF042B|nr:DUF3623 domain-containing protein [Afifella sp. H1R]
MSLYALPIVFALFTWWFSTGAILYLDGLPRRTFRWSLAGATVLLGAAFYGLAVSSRDASVSGAFVAFTCGLTAWGWHEISFLMGYVTGPRKSLCPSDISGWKRFLFAVQTILYHELAIFLSAAVIVALTWGGPNQLGTGIFFLLWGMRASAKLNLFLGVRNLSEQFLPDSLAYLKSFMVKKSMNPLFPISITVATVITVLFAQRAIADVASPFEATAYTFLATLMALAVLEHWFMVLPLPAEALWKWGLRTHEVQQPNDQTSQARPSTPFSARTAAALPGSRLRAQPALSTYGASPPRE